MKKESKYKSYTVEDFVEDAAFRKWVASPDEILDSFWKNFQKEFPKKQESIVTARKIVNALTFEEKMVRPDEYRDSLQFLKSHLWRKRKQLGNVRKLSLWWGKVAAILVLPLLVVSVYLYLNTFAEQTSQMVQYIVPDGQKSHVILADGTSVWLNSGSILSYPIGENKNVRKVHLSGEAYFDVTKDKNRPFLVETKNYTVKVYGTKFNVRVYDDTDEGETILEEGSVSILTANKEVKMSPGQRFFLNKDRKYDLSQVDPDLYLSWKDNVLKINNERLQDLVIRMERWYGVKIRVGEFERVKDLRYTLTIKTESLREMLGLMKYVTPFDYQINGENVILNYN